MGKRAALYLRVSTSRQAEKDLSIPDQRRQAEANCKSKNWPVVAEYVEPGRTATDDKRPKLQQLIADAMRPDRPFDVVVVHSFSRFFRDAFQFEFYRRKLERYGVAILSITQELGDDPMDGMIRQILNLFDEYQSKETAKHVLRAMKENARQGFWNGSQPPFGYRTVPVEVRADVVKKKLEIEPAEAEIVEIVFALYLEGRGTRAIATTLNLKGYRYRRGRLFRHSLVHQMLTRTTYIGKHYFNKTECKTRRKKDRSEWIEFESPEIVDPVKFNRVQQLLNQRAPKVTAPRIVNGPTLLTGLAKCADCGSGMTLRTGKGGRYRYYTCNSRATEGKCGCKGRSIRMERLDTLVVDHLSERIFAPERMEALLRDILNRNRGKCDELAAEAKRLRKELRRTEEKIDRLYDALANGLVNDADGFRRSVSKFEQQREELMRRISGLDRNRDIPKDLFSPVNISRFANTLKAKLNEPNAAFRKQYLRLFVDRIEVDDEEIRISGSKRALAEGIAKITKPGNQLVPSFGTGWWARQDSNLQPDRYERPALTS